MSSIAPREGYQKSRKPPKELPQRSPTKIPKKETTLICPLLAGHRERVGHSELSPNHVCHIAGPDSGPDSRPNVG